MMQRSLQSSNSLHIKAASMLGQNKSPRSNSRKKTPTHTNSQQLSSFSQAAFLKSSSFYAQHGSQPIQSTIPLNDNSNISNYNSAIGQNSVSGYNSVNGFHTNGGYNSHQMSGYTAVNGYNQTGAYNSVGSCISQQMSVGGNSIITGSQQNQYLGTNNSNNYKLICKRHDKGIEKICTKIGCEQQVLLCSDCYFDSQQHIGLHKEHMFNYDDFISVCKSFSLSNKDDFSSGNKQLSALLAKLDRQVLKYRNHIKKEEEKIDTDFNALIVEFTRDMEEIKSKLKAQLQQHFDKFQEMSKSLKTKAYDLQLEKESNIDIKNDFDDFLKNIKDITQQKCQQYNFKKIFQNISPLLTRFKEQMQKNIQKQSQSGNLVFNTEQSETLSCFTGMTGYSYLTLNLAQQPHLAPIKDLFTDFKELSSNKPYYKNKGEGQKLYGDVFDDIKRIYYDLLDSQSLFIKSPKPKLALDFNKEKLDALTIEEKPEIEALQFIEKTDQFTLKEDEKIQKIEFIKNVNIL